MKRVYDENQIEYWLEKEKIRDYFDTKNLKFYICLYDKGEYVTRPDRKNDELLFIVQGKIQVYSIRGDGTLAPVDSTSGLTLIGDVEFSQKENSMFFTEAKTDLICVALSVSKHRSQLDCDVRFLHMLLKSYSDKLRLFALMDVSSSSIEERVLLYMRDLCPSHELNGVDTAVHHLRCSRRQLQRVLKELCESGKIKKIGRGRYVWNLK